MAKKEWHDSGWEECHLQERPDRFRTECDDNFEDDRHTNSARPLTNYKRKPAPSPQFYPGFNDTIGIANSFVQSMSLTLPCSCWLPPGNEKRAKARRKPLPVAPSYEDLVRRSRTPKLCSSVLAARRPSRLTQV
ncbi:hypothetical protein CCUS01_05067 [Colletotrichum cuscutae]|uniref:Uncharacterized protein n=1 Tax=Colletotrichum cuscutae TaxID=1209917 RepID=A0AAI9Y582_9PEZI|nr:hypothetical protein CCUS01_05067 [Colletotrichum cuscutae]